jgi:hypothetical protein
MDTKPYIKNKEHVTTEEVKSLLEVGRILFSVLTPEEIAELKKLVSSKNNR